jgi:hypothetical protein
LVKSTEFFAQWEMRESELDRKPGRRQGHFPFLP